MDLIYTDKNKVEQGIITNYTFDQEDTTTTANDCTFEIQIASSNNILDIGSFVYIPGTELGGRVDTIKIDTAAKIIYASGRTWRGLLATKLLMSASASYQIAGNATEIFATLITSFGLANIFTVPYDPNIPRCNTKVSNYTDLYRGMLGAVTDIDYKIQTTYVESIGKVVISFVPIGQYTNANIITSDMFEFSLQKGAPRVNHAIGKTETMVVDRFLQADGSIGASQHYFGIDEIMQVYDFDVDTEEELISETDAALQAEKTNDKLEVTALNISADLGDYFEAEDIETGIKMAQNVTRKIAKISRDIITYQYKVGERRL